MLRVRASISFFHTKPTHVFVYTYSYQITAAKKHLYLNIERDFSIRKVENRESCEHRKMGQ